MRVGLHEHRCECEEWTDGGPGCAGDCVGDGERGLAVGARPSERSGFVCQFPNAFSTCTQTAIAMTNQDRNAYFRYWLPGAINLDSPTSPDPAAVISASATSTCSCGMGSGSAEPLDITLQPHPYINEDRPITLQDLEGLQALIRTDTTPSQARRDADRILKLRMTPRSSHSWEPTG